MKGGDLVEIVEGVLPGEKVVTQGNYQLQFATTSKKTEEPVPKSDETRHQDQVHGADGASRFHFPSWAWAIGGFALGGFLFGFLLRRTA